MRGYFVSTIDSRGQTKRGRGLQCYCVTLLGSTFSLASAALPLRHATAERRLAEFLDRVRAVNANDGFFYRVHKVILFGSYLTDRKRINDIDVAVELVVRGGIPPFLEPGRRTRSRRLTQTAVDFPLCPTN